MGGYIKGIAAEKVFSELQNHIFPDKSFKKRNGYFYLPFTEYVSYFHTMIGPENYSFLPCGKSDMRQIGSSYYISFTGVLKIFDDEGNVIKQIAGTGGSDIAISSRTGHVINYNNDELFALQNAFISCLRFLGIAKEQLYQKNHPGKTGTESSHSSNTCQNSNRAGTDNNDCAHVVCLKQHPTSFRYGYKIIVDIYEYKGENDYVLKKKNVPMIIFNNTAESMKKAGKWDVFFSKAVPGAWVSILGSIKNYNGEEQIIFKQTYGGGTKK